MADLERADRGKKRWSWPVPMLALMVIGGLVVAMFRRPTQSLPVEGLSLRDVSDEVGIDFVHTDGATGERYIMETVASGLALFDYDGDGLIDIYLLNGAPLGEPIDAGDRSDLSDTIDASDQRDSGERSGELLTPAKVPRNALYRNLGNWKFVDVTDQAGVGDPGYGLGVAVADFDNDGFPDIFVNNFGPNVLYRNNGDGTFTDIAMPAGVQGGDEVAGGAAFLDIDGDGHLDLYVTNYLEFAYDQHVNTTLSGVPAYASPKAFPPAQDRLYRNQGDGTFTDVTDSSGIAGHLGWGMGLVAGDFNRNGHTDIFVANDVCGNFLFLNDGTGRFAESGLLNGIAYDLYGSPQGSMGAEPTDFDNDGWLDIYQTSYQLQHGVLYRNRGEAQFEDVTLTTGAGAGTYAQVTWGVGAIDFDNDGLRDLFVACGHLQDRIAEYDRTTDYLAANVLLRNIGNRRFLDISTTAGNGLRVRQSSRGAAFDDLDNDGRIDSVISNSRAPATVLRNESDDRKHWVQFRLVGTRANRDAVGSRVEVTCGELTQVAEVHSGRGYQSHYGTRLHFGLGDQSRIDRLEIHWHGGETQVLENLPIDRLHTLIEPTP